MQKGIKKIAVTGSGGQIGYSLLFRIAAGELLGKDQPIELHLHDLQESLSSSVKGVVMELEDSCFPLLKKVAATSDLYKAFEDADIAILAGAKPRGPQMQRKDLLKDNGEFFERQGRALNKQVKKDALVFVVGNPCNTNCLISLHHAPDLKKENFHAMTRLDQNRAVFQLAQKASVAIEDVKNVAVWGNHSNTLVVDFVNAQIRNSPLLKVITDHEWLRTEFLQTIQKRGAEIIRARGKSSAASASQAILDGIKEIITPTSEGRFYSSAVISDKNPYGIEEGLIFSFPLRTGKDLQTEIVSGLVLDSFLEEKIKISQKELMEERDAVFHLVK